MTEVQQFGRYSPCLQSPMLPTTHLVLPTTRTGILSSPCLAAAMDLNFSTGIPRNLFPSPWRDAAWLGIVSFVLILRGKIPIRELTKDLRPKALAGVGIYLNYTLVLISMAFVQNISYVVAFRQLSLPIGVLLGVLVLKEHLSAPKLLGISVMFAGLVLVSLG